MKPWPNLVIGLGMILSISCSKGKFSEDKNAGDNYDIKIVDPNADATAAPGTTTATVEGPDAGVDSKDSGGGAGTGADAGDSGSGKGGTTTGTGGDDSTDSSDGTSGKGSDKGSDKGNGKEAGKGGDADAGECASAAGINKSRVKVSGNQKSLTMAPGDAFALKVTGNQNVVNLKMTGDAPGARVSAICLFLAGNQSHVTMDIGVSVGRIFIKARGNKALVEGSISKDGVIENLQVDANGNQPSIVMKGEGTYPCDQAAVSCQKP
ncbi:MAG TPA: hypothetical protein VFO10_03490 [Oligoflexus sp.]|uniref:hypothetical protein n=1 Tax=Oligoflexus sp. TaxID=1971216 RepID=UPI002D7F53D1|nr:hypothetical protein [Oligoflexus sp.]HET9236287.1 hypothetical protein [Oligoflexus sp.]